MQNMKDTSMLTVAEAVAYLNKKEQFSSKKNSASRMSSTSRKSLRSAVSSKSYGRKNNTVSKHKINDDAGEWTPTKSCEM